MGFEDSGENISGGQPKQTSQVMTLQKAIDMGEYDPDFLATFPEWHQLTRHIQWEMIRQGLRNRRKQLVTNWGDIQRQNDFLKKPHLAAALKNVEKQLSDLKSEEERLLVEYST